jgi:hypothetical protein
MKVCACLLYESLREVSVSFETRGGVGVVLINLGGCECNFPLIFYHINVYIRETLE